MRDFRRLTFSDAERKAVEARFKDDIMYNALELAFGSIMTLTTKNVKLEPSELFYQLFCVIDALRGKNPCQQRMFCIHDLWCKMHAQFCSVKKMNESREEMYACIATVCWAAGEVLELTGDHVFVELSIHLFQLINSTKELNSYHFHEKFSTAFFESGKEKLILYIRGYLSGDVYYSKEIEEVLTSSAASSAKSAASACETSSSVDFSSCGNGMVVRIAERKKTSVMVVLNAMYKAGWLVGKNGNQIMNRDDTLNVILHDAFGEKSVKGISQLLKPSNNYNSEEKNEKLLNDLLDEDNIAKLIRDIRHELL